MMREVISFLTNVYIEDHFAIDSARIGHLSHKRILFTPSLNDVFEIKNELKKLHIEPFLHMPRYYKNAKKQIFSWKKIIYTIKFCVLLPLIGKSAS